MLFNKKKKIICIGSSSKDIFFPTDKGIIFETPEDLTAQRKIAFELGAKYQVQQRYEALGGCAANVAVGLAKLGIETWCFSKIGDDALSSWIENEFQRCGVKTNILQQEKKCRSDLSLILVDEATGERTIFSDRDANEKLKILPEKLVNAEWLFLSSLNGEWQKHLQQILAIAKNNSIKLAFNPGQKNIATDGAAVIEFAAKSKILLVNKDESLEIVEHIDPTANAQQLNDEVFLLKKLKENGSEVVLLTDGICGAWVITDSEILHAEALVVKALDTTGSGDACTSGFLGAILNGKSTEDALKWAIVNSSSAVQYYGGQAGLLNKNEINIDISKIVVTKIK